MTKHERPILMSAPMVLALLAGTKTQTRRAMRPQPVPDERKPNVLRWGSAGWSVMNRSFPLLAGHSLAARCPYGRPGDTLWVRESWRAEAIYDGTPPVEIPRGAFVQTEADKVWHQGRPLTAPREPGKLRPGIHLPRTMARATLLLTEVRIERLDAISEADALAEGVEQVSETSDGWWRHYGDTGTQCANPRDSFRSLVETIHGPRYWASAPWVWVLSFARITPPPGGTPHA